MRVRESEEMYLETILRLRDRQGNIRSVDIVEELGYAKSSVSRAVNLLRTRGYIDIDKAGNITLTATGLDRAQSIYERHTVITRLLRMLGASEEIAEDNACRIEHVLSEEMFKVVKSYLDDSDQA